MEWTAKHWDDFTFYFLKWTLMTTTPIRHIRFSQEKLEEGCWKAHNFLFIFIYFILSKATLDLHAPPTKEKKLSKGHFFPLTPLFNYLHSPGIVLKKQCQGGHRPFATLFCQSFKIAHFSFFIHFIQDLAEIPPT